MLSITPFLWFDTQAEEAARFYTSLFENSRIVAVTRYPDAVPDRAGSVLLVTFELAGHQFHAMNAGSDNQFSDAISLLVECETQEEIDHYWDALLADGGQPSRCGWLTDRFGLSWQVIPAALGTLLTDADPAKAARVGQALMTMQKLDLGALQAAQQGEPATA